MLLTIATKSANVIEGNFLYTELIPKDMTLPGSITVLEGEDKSLFLDFISHMLTWLPEKRKPANELAHHPWLNCG